MNHDGTRSSCLSHGSLKVKQEATKTPGKEGPRADVAAERIAASQGVWVLGSGF